ncbi:MAG: hypothetical protein PHV82_01090 [Victivallaceae bacterium]|nr:hypothetical protein [Victivallaceae bacterium]
MNTPIHRHTNTELFNKIYEAARKAGELARLIEIEDYHLAETFHVSKLTDYNFDVLYMLNYGSSEGAYIDAHIAGFFDESKERKRLKLGTIKTLETDLNAMKIMGEACGILTHFAREYINANLNDFSPENELRRRDG